MKIFDAHFHVIDPRFPVVPNEGFVPERFTVRDYLRVAEPLGVVGGAVVSGSFQGFDQRYLVSALRRLGPSFVGVTQLPPSVTDDVIRRLDGAGVRAVRFNLRRHGSVRIHGLREMAARLWDLVGWHSELYVEGRELDMLSPIITGMPRVVIDHLGLTRRALPPLLRLVEGGVYVKASGFGRLHFDPAPVLREIAGVNPGLLVFGTDLPSTRAPRPFRDDDLALLIETLGPRVAGMVLYENAVDLYRPPQPMTVVGRPNHA